MKFLSVAFTRCTGFIYSIPLALLDIVRSVLPRGDRELFMNLRRWWAKDPVELESLAFPDCAVLERGAAVSGLCLIYR